MDCDRMGPAENGSKPDVSKTEMRVVTSRIEGVKRDQQASELQSLDLDVYELSTFENGVIAQVTGSIEGENILDVSESLEEDECSRKVRLGEMTPFGNVLTNDTITTDRIKKPQNGFEELQRYLQDQAKLQKTRKRKIVSEGDKPLDKPKAITKKFKKPQEFIPGKQIKKTSELKVKKKRLPQKFLGSVKTKKKKGNKLGTKISRKRNLTVSPGLQPGEENCVNDSGSEYHPSSDEESDDSECNIQTKKVNQIRFGRRSFDTDDSDWASSDEETWKKRKAKHELDDGDLDFYEKRLKNVDKDSFLECHNVVKRDGFKCPKVIWDKLYLYQKVAVSWFWELNKQRCGGILGDEMGLGKTIQLIAFLASLHSSQLTDFDTDFTGLGPSIIVCPTTVMHQWVREFHNWFPLLRVVLLHDSGTYTGKNRAHLIDSIQSRSWGILITTYTGLLHFQKSILSKNWHYIILDEGHKIRNPNAQVTAVAKQVMTPHRIILSGTPMQNHLKEIWSLIDFVYPGKLSTLPIFISTFDVPISQGGFVNATELQVLTGYKCAIMLRDIVNPYLLRRTKVDVDDHIHLPQKTEQVLLCKLTKEQRNLYKEYLGTVDIEGIMRGRVKIFVGLINLRKICNHPDLYSGGPKRDFIIQKNGDINDEQRFGYWERAGKMIVIQTLLKIWRDQNHRVLLFTQSKKMLVILEDFVKNKGYTYLKLDGSTSVGSRQPLIDKFNNDKKYFVMLLTTKVGGLGINLTGADRIVIYDPDWNPATDTQARERAWRIGQEKDVTIYRLVTAGTIEEKIYHRQIFKQFLSNKVLIDPRQRRFFKSNDLMELFTLSETIKDGTNETSAIFAGTGSEIEVPKKPIAKYTVYSPSNESVPKILFSKSKIEEMKKRAQALSKRLTNSLSLKGDSKSDSIAHPPASDDGPIQIPSTSKQGLTNGKEDSCDIQSTIKKDRSPQHGFNDNVCSSEERVKKKCGCNELNNNISCVSKHCAFKKKDCDYNNQSEKGTKQIDVCPLKKKKEKKRSRGKSSAFEGIKVPHLLKCEAAKDKKSEIPDNYMTQDDYVLHKLFSKSGIETALKHDTIMGVGPSDYAIVEAEAERVAKHAVQTLKNTRSQVPQVRKPAFRTSVRTVTEDTKLSSQVLQNMKQRNLIVESSPVETQLVVQMVAWLCAQGGTATTEQIINQFTEEKLGSGKSPVFRALLSKIAQFYRGPDKIGYWTVLDEFK